MRKDIRVGKGYEDLANAIVIQACIDYQDLLGKNSQADILRRESVVDFFHSELYGLITDINPDMLIKRLENGSRVKFPDEEEEEKGCEVA